MQLKFSKLALPFSVIAIVVVVGAAFLLNQSSEPQPSPTPTPSPTPSPIPSPIPSPTPAPQPVFEEDSKYIGTYRFGKGEVIGRSGLLMIKSLRPGVFAFYLDVNRGAPSYNMGSIDGEVTFEDGAATYTTIREYGGICQLTFELKDEKMIVEQTEKDFGCGFGGGVHANGEYVRTSAESPVF